MNRSKPFLIFVLAFLTPSAAWAQTRTIVDPDSVLIFEVPEDWSDSELGAPDATVQMANAAEDAFLMIIIEPKDDFFGWNMTRFVYVTIGQSAAVLDFPEVSPVEYTEVDECEATRVIVSGAAGGQQFTYLKIAVDAPSHWVQVILGSKRSSWSGHLSEFDEIIESVEFISEEEQGANLVPSTPSG